MNFKEAFEAMKHGEKVKLPGWNGTGVGTLISRQL